MKFHSLAIAALLATALHAAPARHPSYESLPPPTSSARANLFLKANVTASGYWDSKTPELAVNGNLDLEDHWACENLPVWHQVNLDQPTEIAAIRILPFWGGGRIYQYKIEGSSDGENWKMLADMTANSIASTSEGNLFSFDPMILKQVRTTFTGNSNGAASGGHIVEIEGFAKAPDAKLAGGIGTTDQRYPAQGSPGDLTPPRSRQRGLR